MLLIRIDLKCIRNGAKKFQVSCAFLLVSFKTSDTPSFGSDVVVLFTPQTRKRCDPNLFAFQSSLLLTYHICYPIELLTVMLLKQFSNMMNRYIPLFKELACMGSRYFVLSIC